MPRRAWGPPTRTQQVSSIQMRQRPGSASHCCFQSKVMGTTRICLTGCQVRALARRKDSPLPLYRRHLSPRRVSPHRRHRKIHRHKHLRLPLPPWRYYLFPLAEGAPACRDIFILPRPRYPHRLAVSVRRHELLRLWRRQHCAASGEDGLPRSLCNCRLIRWGSRTHLRRAWLLRLRLQRHGRVPMVMLTTARKM